MGVVCVCGCACAYTLESFPKRSPRVIDPPLELSFFRFDEYVAAFLRCLRRSLGRNQVRFQDPSRSVREEPKGVRIPLPVKVPDQGFLALHLGILQLPADCHQPVSASVVAELGNVRSGQKAPGLGPGSVVFWTRKGGFLLLLLLFFLAKEGATDGRTRPCFRYRIRSKTNLAFTYSATSSARASGIAAALKFDPCFRALIG